MAAKTRRSESVAGHLVGIAIFSALAWWLLSLTALPMPVVAWLSGLVAGWCCLPAISRAGRAAAVVDSDTQRPRSRRRARTTRGAR